MREAALRRGRRKAPRPLAGAGLAAHGPAPRGHALAVPEHGPRRGGRLDTGSPPPEAGKLAGGLRGGQGAAPPPPVADPAGTGHPPDGGLRDPRGGKRCGLSWRVWVTNPVALRNVGVRSSPQPTALQGFVTTTNACYCLK